jgi:hypothetical protein
MSILGRVIDSANSSLVEVGGEVLPFGLIALGAVFVFALFLMFYVYTAWAWMAIANKLKYKYSWLAWIPFANLAMILQLGGFHWAWMFLILIPLVGWLVLWVLLIIATWRVFERRKYPGWFSLAMIIPRFGTMIYLIIIGFVAWKDLKKRLL